MYYLKDSKIYKDLGNNAHCLVAFLHVRKIESGHSEWKMISYEVSYTLTKTYVDHDVPRVIGWWSDSYTMEEIINEAAGKLIKEAIRQDWSGSYYGVDVP